MNVKYLLAAALFSATLATAGEELVRAGDGPHPIPITRVAPEVCEDNGSVVRATQQGDVIQVVCHSGIVVHIQA